MKYLKLRSNAVGDLPITDKIQIMENAIYRWRLFLQSAFGQGGDAAAGAVFENDLGLLKRGGSNLIQLIRLFNMIPLNVHALITILISKGLLGKNA